jgi:hypothetical protein
MRAEKGRVPEFLLEQYALGELGAAEEARMAEALRGDPSLRRRLADIEASNKAILEEEPPAQIAAAIRRRLLTEGSRQGGPGESPRPWARRAARGPLPVLLFPAAAAVLVLAGTLLARDLLFPGLGDLTRPKGGAPGLEVFRQGPSGPEELRDGALAAAGDLLQLKYSASGSRHGAILSIDGRGGLSSHLPSGGGTRSVLLAPGGAVLGSAYELDDAPLFERFFILSSREDFDLAAVRAALRELAASGPDAATAAPRLPPGLEWKSLLLRKGGGAR